MGYQGTLGGLLRIRRFSNSWASVLLVLAVFLLWRGYRGSGQLRKYKNPHDYKYLSNPGSSVCGQSPVSLLVLVTSGLQHGERRRAIRESWGSSRVQQERDVRLVFLL